MLRSIEPLLKQYGVKLHVQILYRAPAECGDCVDHINHIIIMRIECKESPEICRQKYERG
jgi:hypothetical protein